MKTIQRILSVTVTLLLIIALLPLHAQVTLPRLVSDGMILQRNTDVKVWGWASPGEKVTVSFLDKKYTATTDNKGNWSVMLEPAKAGGPYTMKIDASNHITLQNIMMGEVWVASGQSNMVIPMERVKYRYPVEIANSKNDSIRQFTIPDHYDYYKPNKDVYTGKWESANPQTVLHFSAVAYFFAKDLKDRYHVPVGIIKSCVGGTPVEAWMSEDALKKFPDIMKTVEKFRDSAFVKQTAMKDMEARNQWYRALAENDKGHTPGEKSWSDPDLDDTGWPEMSVPSFWVDQGAGYLNGIVWFRKDIDVPASMTGKPGLLWMGRIVDADSVFVNGKFVGSTGYQYPPRIYEIPEGILKAGKNNITVKIINVGGKGGFIKDKPYRLDAGGQSIDLKGEWKYKVGAVSKPIPASTTFMYQPGGLYNGMIAPITNYKIKGVLWYQGESNASRACSYHQLFSTMIKDWREKWDQGTFPFLFVQLPNYMPAKDQPSKKSDWALMREAQLQTLSVPNTAMAVAIDVGEWNDIHPLDKKDVGDRLALAARKLAYGEKNLVSSGPLYKSAQIKDGKVIISFTHTGSGLMVKGGGDLKEFAIAGPDHNYVWANAKIEGNKVVVWSEKVPNPVAVRYAWADNPDKANLFNKEGLPASPFRTDADQVPCSALK